MKCIAFACLTLMSFVASAQEAEKITKPLFPRKNEIGLMADMNIGNAPVASPVGLQYKRWVKPNMGYRIILGYAQYENRGTPSYIGRVGDTVFESAFRTTVPIGYAGVGIEMQRHFYKRVYLYASVELRGGYGSGWYSRDVTQKVENDSANYSSTSGIGNQYRGVHMFALEAMPGIGAKLQFRRVSFGLETSLVHMGFRHISYPNGYREGNGADFDMGSLTQRVFLSYRF